MNSSLNNEELLDKIHDALEETIINIDENNKADIKTIQTEIDNLKKSFAELKDTVATEIKQSKLIEILNKLL